MNPEKRLELGIKRKSVKSVVRTLLFYGFLYAEIGQENRLKNSFHATPVQIFRSVRPPDWSFFVAAKSRNALRIGPRIDRILFHTDASGFAAVMRLDFPHRHTAHVLQQFLAECLHLQDIVCCRHCVDIF